jgi:FMNH2-dependent dimethyl sulfone monooxygenase
MFGWQRIEHDHRYAMAAEFLDAAKRLWGADENISITPELSPWKLDKAFITPKPQYGRPLLVNATGSDAGIEFAARQSDLVFITSPGGGAIADALASLPAHTARVKAAGAGIGRRLKTLINPMIVCRDTEREAWDYHDAIAAHADPVASMQNFNSDAHAWRGRKDHGQDAARAVGGNIRLIGSPEQIVEQVIALKEAGIDGIQLSFFDFQPDLEHFGQRVLPLLKQAGLRL